MKMSFFTRLKAALSPRFDDFIASYMKGDDPRTGEVVMTEDTAMKYSAVFACFRVLAETFASVPIIEYKKIDDSDREKTDETGLYDILHVAANDEMSAYNLKESLMYQLCAGGNAVAKRLKNSVGGTVGLYPIEWQRLKIERSKETKKLEYTITDTKEVLSRADVLHIPGPSMGGVVGMSILEYATATIRLGVTYERFAQKYFENGAFPSGVFEHPGHLRDEAFERLKKDLKEKYQSMGMKGEPILAEDGLKFNPVELKMVDAELLSSKKFQVEDICRFCRVPLHLVQNLDKATNNNIEHQSLEFVMYTMLPHYKRAEECINAQLLTQKQRADGYYHEFNINALLRGDSKSMAEAFAAGRQWGWLSVNDIRRLLNMNKIPNGDIYLQPINMIEAGKEPPKQTPPDTGIVREIENLIKASREL